MHYFGNILALLIIVTIKACFFLAVCHINALSENMKFQHSNKTFYRYINICIQSIQSRNVCNLNHNISETTVEVQYSLYISFNHSLQTTYKQTVESWLSCSNRKGLFLIRILAAVYTHVSGAIATILTFLTRLTSPPISGFMHETCRGDLGDGGPIHEFG